MTEHLKIREYKPGDKVLLLEILKLNVPEYFAQSEVDEFDDYLENKIEKYFVAEIDAKVIGAGGINFENNYRTGII
ncbi:MAG: GNAT family N-acetyltransferase, partial [Flavobacteriales bacterium]|nr:GNAT family N-acetyltransferase [Flavobacteriales bacterium]